MSESCSSKSSCVAALCVTLLGTSTAVSIEIPDIDHMIMTPRVYRPQREYWLLHGTFVPSTLDDINQKNVGERA